MDVGKQIIHNLNKCHPGCVNCNPMLNLNATQYEMSYAWNAEYIYPYIQASLYIIYLKHHLNN